MSKEFDKWFNDYDFELDDISSLQSLALDSWNACKLRVLEIEKYSNRHDFECGNLREEIEQL